MKTRLKGGKGVGRVRADVELANYQDMSLAERGLLPPEKVRRKTFPSIVDCGATRLVLPEAIAKELGLIHGKKITVTYADGRQAVRKRAEGVYLKLLDREGIFTAIIEPRRTTALVGAIVLEDLDLLVDCPKSRVIPRFAEGPMYEIE
jgi:predicted aspartyl protease